MRHFFVHYWQISASRFFSIKSINCLALKLLFFLIIKFKLQKTTIDNYETSRTLFVENSIITCMIRLKKDVIGVGLGVGGATGCCFLCLFGSSEVLGLFVLPSRVGRARPIPSAQSHPRISTYAPARKITETGKPHREPGITGDGSRGREDAFPGAPRAIPNRHQI